MGLYMLSTDIATCLIRGESKALDARIAAVSSEELCISAVTRGELLLGVSRHKKGAEKKVASMDRATLEALRKSTHNMLAALTPKEAKALRVRFGIDQSSKHTLESVGEQFDRTREWLRSQEQAQAQGPAPAPEGNLSGVVDQFLTRVTCLPWDAAAATSFATVAFELHNLGTLIGTADTMIAGHAIAVGAVLVVVDEQGFPRVAGLTTENWTRRRATQ
jgi:predicted nucleic acid-binding protein